MITAIGSFFATLPPNPLPMQGSRRSSRPTGAGKVFEIYIYTRIVQQFLVRRRTWAVSISNGRNSTVTRFVFRGAPGVLWGHPDFSFFVMRHTVRRDEFELHLGVQVNGRSNVMHEIDVGVYDHAAAAMARRYGSASNVTGRNIPLTVECKNHQLTPVTKELARQCLGVGLETHRSLVRNLGMFVTTGDDLQVEMLLNNYGIEYFGECEPSNPHQVRRFESSIRRFMLTL